MPRTPLIVGMSAALAGVLAAAPSAPAARESVPVFPAGAQQQVIDVVLSNTASHPRIGLPDFVVGARATALGEMAVTLADVLAYDLDFEREFYIIPRQTSASVPAASTPDTLPFARWTSLGADYVLLGEIQDAAGAVTVTVRMVSVRAASPGKVSWGQTYEGCTPASPRYCAHAIADDIHRTLRGVEGIARTRIAFTSDRAAIRMAGRPTDTAGYGKEIYLMDYDGANPRAATANRSLNLGAAWSPDGQMLAYTTYVSQFPDILVASLFEVRRPTRPGAGDDDVHNMFPAFSPDGSTVAFASTRASRANWDIWVVRRDGTSLRNLTPNTRETDESVPSWSPGGNQIVFTSNRSGTNQIYVMNAADGLGVRRLPATEYKTDRPRWAPAPFNYIAFVTESGAIHDIAVLDLDTMQTRILTDGVGSNTSPTIAPNGRHIAFVTTRWGKEQIAVIDYPDGKRLRRLTDVSHNTYPSWSPIPGR